jgi:hypothetical protein
LAARSLVALAAAGVAVPGTAVNLAVPGVAVGVAVLGTAVGLAVPGMAVAGLVLTGLAVRLGVARSVAVRR